MATKTAISSSKKSTDEKPKTSTVEAIDNGSSTMTFKSICAFVNKTPIIGKLVAEFIGTFLLTAAFFEMPNNPIPIAFAMIGIVLIVGGISGSHINPAMTIGAFVTRKISGLRAIGYIIAQFLGAGAGYLVLNAFIKANEATAISASTSSIFHAASITDLTDSKKWYLFFAELLGAAILGLGFAAALRIKKNKTASALSAGFAMLIALYITMSLTISLLTESSTGLTFLNPAVAFAANGLSWNLWPIAIFVLAPVLGGIIGFAVQSFLQSQTTNTSDCDCCNCCDCDNCK